MPLKGSLQVRVVHGEGEELCPGEQLQLKGRTLQIGCQRDGLRKFLVRYSYLIPEQILDTKLKHMDEYHWRVYVGDLPWKDFKVEGSRFFLRGSPPPGRPIRVEGIRKPSEDS